MSSSSIIIKKATKEDFSEILRVHQNSIRRVASQDHDQAQVSAWSDHLQVQGYLDAYQSGEEFFVAVEKSIVIGFSSIKDNTVMAVYVSELGIGKGVGSKLYFTLENLAKERGVKELSLTSSLTARGFYKKLGFAELEEISHQFRAGATVRAFRMIKYL